MSFESVLEWVTTNYTVVLEVAGACVGVASLITGLTKSPKDDKVVAKIRGVLGRFSVVTHRDAPGTLSVPGARAD